MKFATGMIDPAEVRKLQRPMELDLEALFRAMRDDVMRELLASVWDGDTPDVTIDRIETILTQEGGR